MTHYRLPPLVEARVGRFLATAAVEEAVERFGSPVHVLFPQVFERNLEALRAVLDERRLPHRICYAHKANQARAFVAAARRADIGIDVASLGELDAAVAAGFAPERIEATGPKGEPLLRVLVAAGVTINVDNLWELETIRKLKAEHPVGADTPVLLRLSGFDPPTPGRPVSRFGIGVPEVDAALSVAALPESRINLRGLAFHLDSGDAGERVRAFETCLDVLTRAYERGLRPDILNIGGGLRQAFSADPEQFHRYVRALLDGLNGNGPPLGWPGHLFGWTPRAGRYAGTPSFHKYGNDVGGPAFLAGVLDSPAADGSTPAATLRDALLTLWIEPGKALLDHAGITIATVEFTKQLTDGSTVVNLDIGRDSITPVDQEVMLDPVVLHRHADAAYRPCPAGVFLGGRLCLERDLIARHRLFPDRLPLPGDRVVFVNTAAYQMDLSAAAASGHPTVPKIVAAESSGRFILEPDTAV
ncbi:MAG: decarboxylase [Mycobacteriaceae bacterium]|nr:decarboxylase [Mycobacteriaceae bacterium]